MIAAELDAWEFLDVVHWYRMQLTDDLAERMKFNDEMVGPLSSHDEVKEEKPKPKVPRPKWWRGDQNASDANMAAIKLAEARRKRG